MKSRAILITAAFFGSAWSACVEAAPDPTGVWIDHTGRGAVEITSCGAALCGHIVWLQSAGHGDLCGRQIIGNAKPTGETWEGGWIYSPEDEKKYSLELKMMGNNKLRVVGYMGSKLFSETMTWQRATSGLPRCGGARAAAAKPAAVVATPLPAPAATSEPVTGSASGAGAEVATAAPPTPPSAGPTTMPDQPPAAPSAASAGPTRPAPQKAGTRAGPALESDGDDGIELKRIKGKNGKSDRCVVKLDAFTVQFPCP